MIAAIMQPYFFPYIGYFQLMKAVDIFVFHDDAQYIKAGWVHRNRIMVNNEPAWLTMPVQKDSYLLPINQRHYAVNNKALASIHQRLKAYYQHAPEFGNTYQVISGLLHFGNTNIATFNAHLLTSLASKLGLSCRFTSSSEIAISRDLKGQDKVIALCQSVGADHYINPIGGVSLYEPSRFRDRGINLHFLQATPAEYPQFDVTHVPYLSIIDVLMFNNIARVTAMLDQYRLVERDAVVIT